MARRILVDAVYPNETRVVICDNNRIENFDYETTAKKQFKGNVYLAKVTRVEPSLQAAFVEYGEDKHGFLPFSEIHPNYYQIPVEDRTQLIEQAFGTKISDDDGESDSDSGNESDNSKPDANSDKAEVADDSSEDEEAIESEGGEQEDEDEDGGETAFKRSKLYKQYKIQEVVKRNQVVLVQVLKEERGNKGATLTSFISLAGRYCVYKPNSPKQGGVSRRISNPEDRRRLRSVVENLNVKNDASVIIRTVGASKSEQELRRDCEYLRRLWDSILKHTLSSSAPAFIHAEGDLIRRAIRDICDDDIDEILIEGEDAHKAAMDFAKVIMPDSVSRVKLYRGKTPIFTRYHIEEQLTSFFNTNVMLASGGYVVINPTEALISIDVNSGKSTSERNVEETAVKTNLEAAAEIARQLRLRDLSGLVVIDFIDMVESKNRRAVERALRESLLGDRAKVQLGRISPFGLLEMSRQRLRPSFVEANTVTCGQCNGAGRVRAPAAIAAMVLRAIKAEMARAENSEIRAYVPITVGYHLFNYKRAEILMLEEEYKGRILLEGDPNREEDFHIERRKLSRHKATAKQPLAHAAWADAAADFEEYEEDEATEGTQRPRRPKGKPSNYKSGSNQQRNKRKRQSSGSRNTRKPNRSQSQRKQEGSSKEGASIIKGLWQRLVD